jgi:hypothetical protein
MELNTIFSKKKSEVNRILRVFRRLRELDEAHPAFRGVIPKCMSGGL